jgi:hypothetical protein
VTCETCGRKPAETGRRECFRCRVASVGFTFTGGGGYGREAFVGRTNAEFLAENVGDVRRPGVEKMDGKVWS